MPDAAGAEAARPGSGGPGSAGPGSAGPESAGPESAGPDLPPTAMMAAIGGVRGLIDSAVPATLFVVVRLVTGSLTTAIVLSLVSGLVLLALRLQRGEPLQQVGSGFFAVVLAVLVARATGTGKGFFLPGILTTALTGVAFVVSLVVRKPAVGLALAAYDVKYTGWADHPGLRRACRLSTGFWAVTFFIRAGVAYWVYQLPGDRDGLLLVVINAVKWPLIAAAALLTVFLVKRSGYPTAVPATELAGEPVD